MQATRIDNACYFFYGGAKNHIANGEVSILNFEKKKYKAYDASGVRASGTQCIKVVKFILLAE